MPSIKIPDGDGGWIKLPMLGNGVVSVKSFGAVGNGIADDTDSIQRCLNSLDEHGSVYFPTGTYIVSGLTLNTHAVHLYGQGAVLKAKPNTNAPLLTITTSRLSSIIGLTFDGNKSNQSSLPEGEADNRHGIILRNVYFSQIKDCVIQNCSADGLQIKGFFDGTTFMGCDECHIVNNYIQSNGGCGLYIDSVGDLVIDGNNIEFNNGTGCRIETTLGIASGNLTVTNNNFLSNDSIGLDMNSCSRTLISGNHIRNNGTRGLNLIGGKDLIVANNNVHMNGRLTPYSAGIVSGYNAKLVFTGNTITNSDFTATQGSAIELYSVSGCIIQSNIAADNLFSGISVSADSSNVVAKNNIGIPDTP